MPFLHWRTQNWIHCPKLFSDASVSLLRKAECCFFFFTNCQGAMRVNGSLRAGSRQQCGFPMKVGRARPHQSEPVPPPPARKQGGPVDSQVQPQVKASAGWTRPGQDVSWFSVGACLSRTHGQPRAGLQPSGAIARAGTEDQSRSVKQLPWVRSQP